MSTSTQAQEIANVHLGELSTSISARKKEHSPFSCACAYAYYAYFTGGNWSETSTSITSRKTLFQISSRSTKMADKRLVELVRSHPILCGKSLVDFKGVSVARDCTGAKFETR